MRKLLALLICVAVTASLFAGGGSQSNAPATGASGPRVVTQVTPRPLTIKPQFGDQEWYPQPATSYSTTPKYPRQPAVSNTNGYPIVQQPVTLKIAIPYNSYVQDYYDNDLVKYLEQLTNVKVEWDVLPEGRTMERINLMFAAGDNLPDVLYGDVNISSTMQITFGSQGLIIPLQGLIEEHSYNLKKLFQEDPSHYPSMVSADGNVYAINDKAMNEANQVAMRFWINQTFLNNLNMQMPTTTEEYYQYLVAVKTRDPNRNGRADEIPLVGASTGENWYAVIDGFLMNAFIINETSNSTDPLMRRRMFLTEAGRVDVSYNKPQWRQGLEYMRRLFAEGLMAPESFTLNQNELRSLVMQDTLLVGSLPNGGPHNFATTSGERRTHYRVVPPLKGPNGYQTTYWDQFLATRIGRAVITKDCQIPEVAIKWLDYGFTPDFWTRNRYGVLDRDWRIPAPGSQRSVSGGDVMYEEILRWGTPTKAYLAAGVQWTRWASYNRAVSDDPFELEAVLWNARNLYWPHRFMRSVPRNIPFTVTEARDYTSLNREIVEYVDQSLAEFVTGRRALNDANWNTYLQQIDRLGLSRLLQITQTGFDRNWAAALGYRR